MHKLPALPLHSRGDVCTHSFCVHVACQVGLFYEELVEADIFSPHEPAIKTVAGALADPTLWHNRYGVGLVGIIKLDEVVIVGWRWRWVHAYDE